MCVNVKRTGRFLSVLSPMFFVVFYLLCKFLSLSFSIFPFLLPSLSGKLEQFFICSFCPSSLPRSHCPSFFSFRLFFFPLSQSLTFLSFVPSCYTAYIHFFYRGNVFLCLSLSLCLSPLFSLSFPPSRSCYIRLSFCGSAHLFSFHWLAHAHILCLAGVVMVLIGGWPGY